MELSGETVSCSLCEENIKRGIFNMLKHHEEKHGLREITNTFIKARKEKGNPLTVEDLDIMSKSNNS